MHVRKARRHKWQLSFASMSDIAFLLIIFFAVAGKFTSTTEKDVVLPAVDLGVRTEPRELELIVTADGDYWMRGARVQKEALKDEIAGYLTRDMPREERTVRLYADRNAEYAAVADAVEACHQADAYLELAVEYSE